MTKKISEKVKKKVKKKSKKTVLARVAKINRAELKVIPKEKTKYEIAYDFIKENSGKFTRKEIIEHFEKQLYSITRGTSSTTFCQFMNEKYRPAWANRIRYVSFKIFAF